MSAHPEASNLWQRKARQPAEGNTAFIDRQACRDYAAKGQQRLDQTLAAEAVKN